MVHITLGLDLTFNNETIVGGTEDEANLLIIPTSQDLDTFSQLSQPLCNTKVIPSKQLLTCTTYVLGNFHEVQIFMFCDQNKSNVNMQNS